MIIWTPTVWVSYSYMHAFCVFVFAPVQRNWAWKGSLEILIIFFYYYYYYYYYYVEHVHCSLRKVGIHSCSYCLDSKTLTEEQREEIFSKICDNTDMMGWMVHILSSACISRSMLRRYVRTLNISLWYIEDCVSYGEIILNLVKRKE